LYGVDLVRGEATLLVSAGGVGKTTVAIGKSISVATNRRLLDEKVFGTDLKALYINAEDSRDEMRRRVWAFCMKHGLSEQDLGRFSLYGTDDWQVQGISFLRVERGGSVLDQAGIDRFEELLEALRPDLVVLDPLVALCGGGNINDNAAMALVMRALKRLAGKFNCAVLILHHTRKGSVSGDVEGISGASALANLSRRALMAAPMTAEEGKLLGVLPSELGAYFKVVVAKANLAPRSADVAWYRLDSVELPNAEPPIYLHGDRVQAVTRVRLPLQGGSSAIAEDQAIRQAIVAVVDGGKMLADGTTAPYSPSSSGAKNQRGLFDDAMAAAGKVVSQQRSLEDLKAIVERAIGSLKVDGSLVDEEIKSDARFRRGRGLRVDWGRVPAEWRPAPKTPEEVDERIDELCQGEAGTAGSDDDE